MTDEIPYYPYFLDDRPREPAGTPAAAAADSSSVGTVTGFTATGSGAQSAGVPARYGRTVAADAPVAYVAWEEDRVVVGWLWWNDESGALWKVHNYYEPAARLTNGTDVAEAPPWGAELAAAFDEGLPPSRAVQRLMSQPEDAEGRCVPPQDPQRARSLGHLREIAGENDWLAAAARFRADTGLDADIPAPDRASAPPAPAQPPAAVVAADGTVAADPALAPGSPVAPDVAPPAAPALVTPVAAPAAPAQQAPARRRSWLARLFGRR